MEELEQRVPRGLKIAFLLNFVVVAGVGLQHLLAPRLWADLAGMAVEDTGLWRLNGAAVIVWAILYENLPLREVE